MTPLLPGTLYKSLAVHLMFTYYIYYPTHHTTYLCPKSQPAFTSLELLDRIPYGIHGPSTTLALRILLSGEPSLFILFGLGQILFLNEYSTCTTPAFIN
uniref:Uncharacterized protein n=1 Tax=Picea glauca TaxID=3330 RepID=A0A117NHN5_PICGL|nr:hypothetical protein ABT39_MTgene4620 [Picea glauca]QHR92496.1 hypothetical protein Q903MT_gene6542 [Picea sitchensis]